jgi:hypothetical protein
LAAVLGLAGTFALCTGLVSWSIAAPEGETGLSISRLPRLSPDYVGVTIPPNLAPLAFMIREPGLEFRVRIFSTHGTALTISSRSPSVVPSVVAWKELLRANVGLPLYCEVWARTPEGQWRRFDTVTNYIAQAPIDGYLVYRRLRPVYNIYGSLGIYQRNLETYEERPVLENKSFDGGCVNCHTFRKHQPDLMALNIRHKPSGNPMLLVSSNKVARVAKTAGYLSWHPSGRLLAFTGNRFTFFFHTTGDTRDLFDSDSNLGIYRADLNTVTIPPFLARPDRLETWPCWSPDGRYLYFSSAPRLKMERYRLVRYDLMRVAYDIDNDRWGDPETILPAQETHLSATQPRISPDGRWLLLCLSAYGNFPAYQASSDLHLLDLKTRQLRKLEINSNRSDSWHCWSSNGRWIVFSSKRRDGLFTHPYFSHMDAEGGFSKPLLLPQRDPAFYDSYVMTFNVPEFIQSPIPVSPRQLARAIVKPVKVLEPGADSMPKHEDYHLDPEEGEQGRSLRQHVQSSATR